MFSRRWIAYVLIATGALLRFVAAARLPFEQDELYTVDEATHLFYTRLQPGIQARPLFFLLEHPLIAHFGVSPLGLRVLALLFGFVGLWATWRLARSVLSEAAALAALALVAYSPWHAYVSAFARYYSLLFLLAALCYWLIPRAYDSNRPKEYLQALVPLLLGAWTHPSFVFPIAGATLGLTLVDRAGRVGWHAPSRRAWMFLWAPLLGISAAGLLAIRLLYHGGSAVGNGGVRGLNATLRLIPAMVDWATPPVAVAGIVGAILLLMSDAPGRRRFGAMALFGMLGSAVALFALSFRTAIYADYGITAIPLLLVGAAGAVQWVVDAAPVQRRPGIVALTTGFLLAGGLASLASFVSNGTRFDYRPAFARIERDDAASAVLTTPLVLQHYYAPGLHAYELPMQPSALDSLLAQHGRLWAVISVKRYGIVGDDSGAVAQWLGAHCRPVDQYEHPRFDYRMYRVDLWRCASSAGSSL